MYLSNKVVFQCLKIMTSTDDKDIFNVRDNYFNLRFGRKFSETKDKCACIKIDGAKTERLRAYSQILFV